MNYEIACHRSGGDPLTECTSLGLFDLSPIYGTSGLWNLIFNSPYISHAKKGNCAMCGK